MDIYVHKSDTKYPNIRTLLINAPRPNGGLATPNYWIRMFILGIQTITYSWVQSSRNKRGLNLIEKKTLKKYKASIENISKKVLIV